MPQALHPFLQQLMAQSQQAPAGPAVAGPRPFEGGLPGGLPKLPGFGLPIPFEGTGAGNPKLANPFAGLIPGMTSGATGTRGPAASPFLGLQRFAGPFGNGGGAIAPQFAGLAKGMGQWRPY